MAKSHCNACRSGMYSLESLPGDLLLEVGSFLHSRSDILHFSTSSSTLYSNIACALYNSVTLDTPNQCLHTLSMLHRRPEIARHVQSLLVRPHGGRRKRQQAQDVVDRHMVAAAVGKAARYLDALNTFVWDGDGMPPDDMWFMLRMSCPQLRYVGTTAMGGYFPQYSHLFDFKNLLGFSLTFKPISHLHEPEIHNQDELFPAMPSSRLWDMLLNRSPALEELSIDGHSVNPIDAHRLIQGRWPYLRKLTLGDVVVDLHSSTTTQRDQKPQYIQFLEAHPKIQKFSGTLEQLQSLTSDPTPFPSSPSPQNIKKTLQTITFHEPMLMRDATPLVISGLLRGLQNLRVLKVSFVLQTMYESGNLLRGVVGCCPRLEVLELGCGCKPSFLLDSFSKAIKRLYKLSSFSLTLVKFPGDDSLTTSAVLLARSNPRLHTFAITFISNNRSLPLPYPLVSHPCAFLESGRYELTRDDHGLPVSMGVVERVGKGGSWGEGIGMSFRFGFEAGLGVMSSAMGKWASGGSGVRRYKVDLRPGRRCGPLNHGGKAGMMEWIGLMMEGSKAGEEMRLFMCLVVLMCMAVWGFLVVGDAGIALVGAMRQGVGT